MDLYIQQAIFLTNAFADAYPDEHIRLWSQFESEVPYNKRTGVYGADNKAYIDWMKVNRDPVFVQFAQTHLESRKTQ